MNNAVSILALLVSLVSAVAAVAAWRAARDSAAETARLTDIEAGRRHDERKPEFAPTIEAMGSGTWHRLVVTLVTGESVDRLTVEIVGSTGLKFDSQSAKGNDQDLCTVHHLQRLHPHTTDAAWRVSFTDDDRGGRAALATTSWIGDEQWTATVPVDLPPPLPSAYFF